jgi:hypothetical protein
MFDSPERPFRPYRRSPTSPPHPEHRKYFASVGRRALHIFGGGLRWHPLTVVYKGYIRMSDLFEQFRVATFVRV